jgi:hypothetical protein
VIVIASDPPSLAASYGGLEVRRSAEREGGSEAIQGNKSGSWIASSPSGLLAMTGIQAMTTFYLSAKPAIRITPTALFV